MQMHNPSTIWWINIIYTCQRKVVMCCRGILETKICWTILSQQPWKANLFPNQPFLLKLLLFWWKLTTSPFCDLSIHEIYRHCDLSINAVIRTSFPSWKKTMPWALHSAAAHAILVLHRNCRACPGVTAKKLDSPQLVDCWRTICENTTINYWLVSKIWQCHLCSCFLWLFSSDDFSL